MHAWTKLKEREKAIAIEFVSKNKKSHAIAYEMGISRNRIRDLITVIYRLLGVADQVELAFEVGRNWTEINNPKITSLQRSA